MLVKPHQLILISLSQQTMSCYEGDQQWQQFVISSGKNGAGEQMNSEKTPRGWHRIASKIGSECPLNAVFVARVWTGEVYNEQLARANPNRDWILTRIMQLDGLEVGRNQGDKVDSLSRFIYIHGTPDATVLGKPGSKGCIRMQNADIIALFDWIQIDSRVCIE